MADKLLPCPFCGGEAEIREHSDGSGGIWCRKCNFTPLVGASFGRNKTKQDAIDFWNNRVPATDQPEGDNNVAT